MERRIDLEEVTIKKDYQSIFIVKVYMKGGGSVYDVITLYKILGG